MTPTVEEPEVRTFTITLKGGKKVRVRANTICRPNENSDMYVLKLQGQVVAEYHKDIVEGWHISSSSTNVVTR